MTTGPVARRQGVVVGLTLLALLLLLLMPGHPKEFTPAAFLRLPLELPLIVLVLLWTPFALSTALRVVLVVSLCALSLLRLADIGSYLAFNRRFNPLVELHLIGDGWNLASQSVGLLEAGLVFLLAIALLGLLCALLFRGLGRLASLRDRARRRLSVVCALCLLVAVPAFAVERSMDDRLPIQAQVIPELLERWQHVQWSIADLARFNALLPRDAATVDGPPGFEALQGRDVIILFVESYGRSYVDGEGFANAAMKQLVDAQTTLTEAGLAVKSGWVDSPIRGGRSWLAHATLMSGLKIDSQARFDRLIASNRVSLIRLFADAGWQTAGLMPAIQLDWPEGRWYGYDDTFDAERLAYRGEKFGWVTMPDQYTLSAFEHQIRQPSTAPVMAEIALISSHAPWTPLPTQVLPWSMIGDGSVFDGRYRDGPSSAEVWSDRETLRHQYATSIDYMLDVISSYAAQYGEGALLLVVGDHQPAAIVNGWDANAHVPIHLISDDPALLQRLPAELFVDGMVPGPSLQALPMESLRQSLPVWFGRESPSP